MTDDLNNSYYRILDRQIYSERNSSANALSGNWLQTLKFDHIPVIKQDDLDRGYITRYFTRRANLTSGEIVEISMQDKWKLQKVSIFRFVDLPWKISGGLDDIMGASNTHSAPIVYTGVLSANRQSVMYAETEMPGIKLKLTNYTQFYVTG